MGPVTNMTKVALDISSQRELGTFQVPNLQKHEISLGMAWLRGYDAASHGNNKRINLNSKRCRTRGHTSGSIIHAVSEEEARKANLITRFHKGQAKEGQTANHQSVRVKKLSVKDRVPIQK